MVVPSREVAQHHGNQLLGATKETCIRKNKYIYCVCVCVCV